MCETSIHTVRLHGSRSYTIPKVKCSNMICYRYVRLYWPISIKHNGHSGGVRGSINTCRSSVTSGVVHNMHVVESCRHGKETSIHGAPSPPNQTVIIQFIGFFRWCSSCQSYLFIPFQCLSIFLATKLNQCECVATLHFWPVPKQRVICSLFIVYIPLFHGVRILWQS